MGPMGVYGNTLGIKQPTEWTTFHDHGKGKGGSKGCCDKEQMLRRLEDLPDSWWTKCPNATDILMRDAGLADIFGGMRDCPMF